MLAHDPAAWLAVRRRASSLTTWAPALFFAVIIWWFLAHADQAVDSPGLVLLCVLVSHGIYKLWVASEASRKFFADRQNGELELLLSTPLDGRQIWRAHLIQLKQQFIGPCGILLASDVLLLALGLCSGRWLDENIEFTLPLVALGIAFVADSYTAAWVGLWQSLTARSATRATLRTMTFTFILPGGAFFLLLGSFAVFARSPEEAMLWLTGGWFLTGFATDIGLCAWTMAQMSDSFREAAMRPVEATTSAARSQN